MSGRRGESLGALYPGAAFLNALAHAMRSPLSVLEGVAAI